MGTTMLTFGGAGSGAQFAGFSLSREAHFFQTARSVSILMNSPPTTGRACIPPLRTLSVT